MLSFNEQFEKAIEKDFEKGKELSKKIISFVETLKTTEGEFVLAIDILHSMITETLIDRLNNIKQEMN